MLLPPVLQLRRRAPSALSERRSHRGRFRRLYETLCLRPRGPGRVYASRPKPGLELNPVSDDYRPNLRPGSDPLVFFKSPGDDTGSIAKGHIMAAAIAHAL